MKKLFVFSLTIISLSCFSQDLILQVKESLIKNKANKVLKSLHNEEGLVKISLSSKKAQLKPQSLKDIPEAVHVYARGLFGLDVENPLKMSVDFHGIRGELSSNIETLSFKVQNKRLLKSNLTITLDKLKVKIPTIKVRETNIVKQATYTEGKCSKSEPLAKELWAKAGLDIRPKYRDMKPIKLSVALDLVKSKDGFKAKLKELTSNLATILNKYYKITIKNLRLPEIFIVKGEDCYPLGTTELRKFITQKIQEKIPDAIKDLQKKLIKNGLKKANIALEDVEFPSDVDINLYNATYYGHKNYEETNEYDYNEYYVEPAVSTYVHINHQSIEPIKPILVLESGVLKDTKFLKSLFGVIPNMNYNIAVKNFKSIDPKYFGVDLNETLTINGQTEDYRVYRKKLNSTKLLEKNADISLSISESVFNEKFDLINRLDIIEEKLPRGFRFYKDKLRTQFQNGKIILYTSLEVNLNQSNITILKIVKYWEKLFGSSKGKVYIPILLNLYPTYDKTKQVLKVKIRLSNNTSEIKKLKLKSNNQDLSWLLEKAMPVLMGYAGKKVAQNLEVLNLKETYQKFGVKLQDIMLVNDSYLTLVLDLKNIDPLLEKLSIKDKVQGLLNNE